MTIIANLAGFIAFVLFFRLFYLIFKCMKTKDWSLFKKDGIIFIICFILTGIFGDTSSNKKDSTSKSNKTEKVSKKSSRLSSSSTKSSKVSSKISSKNDSSASSSCISSETCINNDNGAQTDNNDNNNKNNNYQTATDDGMDHTAQAGKVIGDAKTHIYHTADQHNYRISPKNEVVFNNEQQAINAGYRKALR